jgi:Family of unknown function (DUF6325)
MDVGPVEMIVLVFPSDHIDPEVVRTLSTVVDQGFVTVLDLVFLSRTSDGLIERIDIDEDLAATGLTPLQAAGQALVSDDDLEVILESLDPGMCAAVIVYEESWARGVAGAVRAADGEVALHVQVPREALEAALLATAS